MAPCTLVRQRFFLGPDMAAGNLSARELFAYISRRSRTVFRGSEPRIAQHACGLMHGESRSNSQERYERDRASRASCRAYSTRIVCILLETKKKHAKKKEREIYRAGDWYTWEKAKRRNRAVDRCSIKGRIISSSCWSSREKTLLPTMEKLCSGDRTLPSYSFSLESLSISLYMRNNITRYSMILV